MNIGHDNIWNVFPVNEEEGIDFPNVDFLFNLSDFEEHAKDIKAMAKKACVQCGISKNEAKEALESGGNLFTNLALLENGKFGFYNGGFPEVKTNETPNGELFFFTEDGSMINIGYCFSAEEQEHLVKADCAALNISEKDYLKENCEQSTDREM